jgi:ABC-type multidrug transport system ATPase subunit
MCGQLAPGSVGSVAPVLSAVDLTKRFGDVTAVRDLSFDVDAGSVVGFLGPKRAVRE